MYRTNNSECGCPSQRPPTPPPNLLSPDLPVSGFEWLIQGKPFWMSLAPLDLITPSLNHLLKHKTTETSPSDLMTASEIAMAFPCRDH